MRNGVYPDRQSSWEISFLQLQRRWKLGGGFSDLGDKTAAPRKIFLLFAFWRSVPLEIAQVLHGLTSREGDGAYEEVEDMLDTKHSMTKTGRNQDH